MERLATIAPPQVHEIWALLSQIPDPEIPVLTITDLGMVRNVTQMGEGWVIGFTPTYSGCPATEHLIGAIREAMTTNGFTPVQVVLQLDPAWTTDWMTPDARERLRQYGISPPAGHSCHAHLPPEVRCLARAEASIPHLTANRIRRGPQSIVSSSIGQLSTVVVVDNAR
ncbi:Putative 1,2-phenylacetyl-CoA epoxidase, subunit D [Escherichia coli]|nr:Putative 1,2-phenylacetyl-CoA epoxidase, subunit D [Escherichia coli]